MHLYCPNCFHPNESDNEYCEKCKSLLTWKEKSYEEKLIKALSHREPATALLAANLLSNFKSTKSEKALRSIALHSEDPYVQAAAINSLKTIGSPRTLPVLKKVAISGYLISRLKAIEAIEKFGSTKEIGFLQKLAEDTNSLIRGKAIKAIRKIGQEHDFSNKAQE
jgi:HEAT repeat protein